MQLEISNEQTGVAINPTLVEYLQRAAELAVEAAGGDLTAEASVVLVDDGYIQTLNKNYRGKDYPTDVLSFAMQETSDDEPQVFGVEEDLTLGDIFISIPTAVRQAAEYGHSVEREVVFLAVHGMLHLLGYDHESEADRLKMREKEEEVMAKLDLRRE